MSLSEDSNVFVSSSGGQDQQWKPPAPGMIQGGPPVPQPGVQHGPMPHPPGNGHISYPSLVAVNVNYVFHLCMFHFCSSVQVYFPVGYSLYFS